MKLKSITLSVPLKAEMNIAAGGQDLCRETQKPEETAFVYTFQLLV